MQSRAIQLSALVLAGATASLVAQAPPRQGGTRAPGDVAVTLRSQPAADAFGNTPLHRAVEAGDAAAVERLLKAKADVNAMNRYHVAPLSIAVLRPRSSYSTRVTLPWSSVTPVICWSAS